MTTSVIAEKKLQLVRQLAGTRRPAVGVGSVDARKSLAYSALPIAGARAISNSPRRNTD
jgi:hypothetical protein